MTDAFSLVQRIFHPSKYWRGEYNRERALRIKAEAREAELRHINDTRLGAILGHERGNTHMRHLLAQSYVMIGKLEGELAETKKQLAPFKVLRARDAQGHYTKDIL